MLNITGYSDQISVAPGDAIKFMVNCEHRAYQADIVRIVSGDLNPEGPGIIEEAITTPVNGRYKGRKQKIYAGSYAIVPSSAPLETLESFTVQVMVWPSTPLKGVQALVSKWSARKKSGFALVIDALRAAPIVPNEFKPIGSSGTTKVILSRADVTPLGNGVAVASAVGVACGIGVAVGCSWAAAGGVAGASAPPQATNIRVNIAAVAQISRPADLSLVV